MDDIISIVVVFIIYLVAASSGSKKKKKKRNFQRPFDQMQQMERNTAARPDEPMLTQREIPLQMKGELTRNVANENDVCHGGKGIHLHDVNQEQMLAAQEGEDPCHAGQADPIKTLDEELEALENRRRILAQDVFRGVMMNEILTRPCERRSIRRNGRRA